MEVSGELLIRKPGEGNWMKCFCCIKKNSKLQLYQRPQDLKPVFSKNFRNFTARNDTAEIKSSDIEKWDRDPNVKKDAIKLDYSTVVLKYVGFGPEFTLVMKDQASIYLAAENEAEAKVWVTALQMKLNPSRRRAATAMEDISQGRIKAEPLSLAPITVGSNRQSRGLNSRHRKSEGVKKKVSTLAATKQEQLLLFKNDTEEFAFSRKMRQAQRVKANVMTQRKKLNNSDRTKGIAPAGSRQRLSNIVNSPENQRLAFSQDLPTGSNRVMHKKKNVFPALQDTENNVFPFQKNKSKETRDFLVDILVREDTLPGMLVKDFDDYAREELISEMYFIQVEEGHTLVSIDQPWDQFYIVETGLFLCYHKKSERISNILASGSDFKDFDENHETIKQKLSRGDAFGETCLLHAKRSGISVESKTSGKLWGIQRKTFQRIANANIQRRIEFQDTFMLEFQNILNDVEQDSHGTNRSIALMDLMEYKKMEKNDVLYDSNTPLLDVYFCCSGSMIIQDGATGTIIGECSLNEAFGVNFLLKDFDPRASLICRDSGSYLSLNIPEARKLLELDLSGAMLTQGGFSDSEDMGYVAAGLISFTNRDSGLMNTSHMNQTSKLQGLSSTMTFPSRNLSEIPDRVYEPQLNVKALTSKSLLDELDFNNLEVRRHVGNGNFGYVYLTSYNTPRGTEFYALKIVPSNEGLERNPDSTTSCEKVNREKRVMAEMSTHTDCRFIVKLYYTFADKHNIFYVLEYCSGGDLYKLVREGLNGQMSEDYARFYLASTLLGLFALHSHDIVFRDLKPGNLLLTELGQLKIADFGIAKKTKRTFTYCGTPEYTPPEIINLSGHNYSADFWAAGIVLFELVIGFTPFYAASDDSLYQSIISHKPNTISYERIIETYRNEFSEVEGVVTPTEPSRAFIDVVNCFLHPRPSKRLGSDSRGQSAILTHPFFSTIDWDALSTGKLDAPFIPEPPVLEKDPEMDFDLEDFATRVDVLEDVKIDVDEILCE